MELGTKLSFIEDIRDSLKKRYYELKKEYKASGNIADGNKQRAITFARGMYESANEHFLEVKLKVEAAIKTDRVSKQISRHMNSIRNYRDKTYKLCDYDERY